MSAVNPREWMSQRRFRFERRSENVYDVAAVTPRGSAISPPYMWLGEVHRHTRSTDSRIAGTRLRRQGKGAPAWTAVVPRAQWDHPADRAGVRLTHQPRSAGKLQRNLDHTLRLEERGQSWDTRGEAAMALVQWYLQQAGRQQEGAA